jgi:hypothetical protein
MWYSLDEGDALACVTKTSQQAKDFSGRWGALLRHTAVLTQEQYRQFGCMPEQVTNHLIERGDADELKQRADLQLDLPQSITASQMAVGGDFSHYCDNLEKLLGGERLVLYADSNNVFLQSYLTRLVAQLPLKARLLLNWSQFLFRAWEEIGLSVVFNSRYETPTEGIPAFVADGMSSLASLELTPDEISDYLRRLGDALNTSNQAELEVLLDSDDWQDDGESAEESTEVSEGEMKQEKSGES